MGPEERLLGAKAGSAGGTVCLSPAGLPHSKVLEVHSLGNPDLICGIKKSSEFSYSCSPEQEVKVSLRAQNCTHVCEDRTVKPQLCVSARTCRAALCYPSDPWARGVDGRL